MARGRRQLQFPLSPLEGKSFFLHVHSPGKARELERKLKEFGGVVEKFLSKELTCVITDQPTTTQRSASGKKGSGSLATDLTNTRGPSRAQAILQKSVRQKKQPAKSTDVFDNAKKWGIQVKPVEQVLKWINTQKKQQDINQSKGRVCSLKGAFLKVEDHSRRYKPLVKELRVWPQLNLDAPPGFSPFDEPVSMRTRSRSSSQSPRKSAKRLAGRKSTERKGYCELCDTHYIGLQKHVNSRRHKLVATHKDTYAELDRLIARGKTLKEFKDERIKKRNSEAQIQTRSRTRSRSPASTTSTSPKRKSTPSATTSSPEGSNRRTASQQSRTPSPGRRAPSKRSKGTTPSRKTPTSPRKSPKKVTPIKLVRFQDDRYSVVKSVVKRHSDQSDKGTSTSYGKSKRKRFDRYSIVETTPMKIRLRRSRRKCSPSTRASKLIGRSP